MPDTPRHRERVIRASTNDASYYRQGYGTTYYNTYTDFEDEDFHDIKVEDFYKRISAGEVIMTQCEHVKTGQYVIGAGRHHFTLTNNTIVKKDGPSLSSMERMRIPGYVLGLLPEPTETFDRLTAAKLRAIATIDKTPYKFLEDVGEAHKTIRFLKSPMKALLDLIKTFWLAVRRLRKDFLLDIPAAVARAWLEFRFAFTPLVISMRKLLESFCSDFKYPERMSSYGVSSDRLSDSQNLNVSEHISSSSIDFDYTYRATIVYEVTNPINDWKRKYGLRFKEIPETIWALTPYSFMIDRVVDITSAISALVSFLDPKINILGGCWSKDSKTRRLYTYEGYFGANVKSHEVLTTDTDVQWIHRYYREPWVPTIADLVPPFVIGGLTNSIKSLIDLWALIQVALSRR
jgi:hypothetical protein